MRGSLHIVGPAVFLKKVWHHHRRELVHGREARAIKVVLKLVHCSGAIVAAGCGGRLLATQYGDATEDGCFCVREAFGGESRQIAEKSLDVFAAQD
ncbi:hypothetical protein D3C73_910450 [compost metagenome]